MTCSVKISMLGGWKEKEMEREKERDKERKGEREERDILVQIFSHPPWLVVTLWPQARQINSQEKNRWLAKCVKLPEVRVGTGSRRVQVIESDYHPHPHPHPHPYDHLSIIILMEWWMMDDGWFDHWSLIIDHYKSMRRRAARTNLRFKSHKAW